MKFSYYLREKRKNAGLTQEQLARSLGVSNTYIHQLETGKIDAPTEKRCRQLARLLKAPAAEVCELARKERLRKYAEREGFKTGDSLGAAHPDLGPLSPEEVALVRLVRLLDGQTRKDFSGMIFMLLRHVRRPEVRENLKRYMESA